MIVLLIIEAAIFLGGFLCVWDNQRRQSRSAGATDIVEGRSESAKDRASL